VFVIATENGGTFFGSSTIVNWAADSDAAVAAVAWRALVTGSVKGGSFLGSPIILNTGAVLAEAGTASRCPPARADCPAAAVQTAVATAIWSVRESLLIVRNIISSLFIGR
jgi:hypothetical protein